MRLFDSLPYLFLGIGGLYAAVAVALARRSAGRAVWAAWLLGPTALTVALAAWLALTVTSVPIPFHRWLLCFPLALAAPAAVAGVVATTRLARRGLVPHLLATLAAFCVAYPLGAWAASRVVDLIIAVQ